MANVTAVQDRLDLTLAELKTRLAITTDDLDGVIADVLDAAKVAADQYMNNPFQDSAGDDVPIPSSVRLGVVQWCRKRLGEQTGAERLSLTAAQTGDLSEQHAVTLKLSDADVVRYWQPFRLLAGL